jgi:hypothetical protein
MSAHPQHGTDTAAAFKGLILGSLFIGGILYGIVVLTNQHFEQEKAAHAAPGAAATTKH